MIVLKRMIMLIWLIEYSEVKIASKTTKNGLFFYQATFIGQILSKYASKYV